MEENKPKKSGIIPALVTIVIVLGIALLYTVLRPTLLKILRPKSTESGTEQTHEQTEQPAAEPQAAEVTEEEETNAQTETATTGTKAVDHSGDIDKDLQSLDSLDLSEPENDFGDDTLSGL